MTMDYIIICFLYLTIYSSTVCLIPIGLFYGIDEFLYRKGVFWTGTPVTFLLQFVILKALGFTNLLDPGVITNSGFDGSLFVVLAVVLVCNTLIGLAILKIPAWYAIKIQRQRPAVYTYRIFLAVLISILLTQVNFYIPAAPETHNQISGLIPAIFMTTSYPQFAVGLALMILSIIGFILEIRNPFNKSLIFHHNLVPPEPLPEPDRSPEKPDKS
jgi:hypothetical protein